MKRIFYMASLLGFLFILNSCVTEPESPRPEPWLCSINADGTEFRKIMKSPFNTPGLVDIYMTKDNRIIFYGDKLWISDTDTIRTVSITDNIYILQKQPARLSQSPDGSKLYFASQDKNIHELDLNSLVSRQLTSETIRTLRNPIVSDVGNYITYTSRGYGTPAKFTEYLFWRHIISGESGMIPTSDSINANAFYSETEDFVYCEGRGINRSKLDGSCVSVVDSIGGSMYPYDMFDVSYDQRFIIHLYNSNPPQFRCLNIQTGIAINLPVRYYSSSQYLCRLAKNSDLLYYVEPGEEKLRSINLSTGENRIILQSTENMGIGRFINIAPTWDGSKVYFYADIAEREVEND